MSRYEESKRAFEARRRELVQESGQQSPVQAVLSNQVPPLPYQPPSSLAYYNVPDALGQAKQVSVEDHSAKSLRMTSSSVRSLPATPVVVPKRQTLRSAQRSSTAANDGRPNADAGTNAGADAGISDVPSNDGAGVVAARSQSSFGASQSDVVAGILESAASPASSKKARRRKSQNWALALDHAKKEAKKRREARRRSEMVTPEHVRGCGSGVGACSHSLSLTVAWLVHCSAPWRRVWSHKEPRHCGCC